MKSEDLARRAVSCRHWRWMPGMRYTLPTTSLHGRWKPGLSPHIMPDLNDAATVGCLLALVRKAWGMPRLVAIPQPDGEWSVWGLATIASGETEVAALVAALESP